MADKKIITKGCKVEVSSGGFNGRAWYVATVVFITPSYENINKNLRKFFKNDTKETYLVMCDTLYGKVDCHHFESVEPRFVRPLPPNDGVEGFKVGDVIDAYHKDGWWIGVVKKVLKKVFDQVETGRTYLVSFEDPPEKVEFEKHRLRFHLDWDWVDSCWNTPLKNKKTQEHVSADINETLTAESNNNAQSGFTTPSRAARPTVIENPSTGRIPTKKRSRLQQNTESNSEMINAVKGVVTYYYRKARSISVNPVEQNSRVDRSQALAGGKRKETVQVHLMERSGSQAMHQDSPIVEQEAITTETSEAEEDQSQQRTKKGRPLLLEETSKTGDGQMVKSPNDLQEGNQNARNMHSSAFNEATSELDELPLSISRKGLRPHSVLNRSQAIISNGGTNNEQQVWPFVKKSSCWATIESIMELHPKQKPHFSPLKKMKEVCREGYAISHMVTFGKVIQDVLGYQPSTPIEKINNSLEILDELEPHGFDVRAVRGRLNMILSSKVKVGELKDELKKFKNDINIHIVKQRAAEVELAELDEKMRELQEKMVWNVKMKELIDQDIKRLQSNVDMFANQIIEAELAINGTPL